MTSKNFMILWLSMVFGIVIVATALIFKPDVSYVESVENVVNYHTEASDLTLVVRLQVATEEANLAHKRFADALSDVEKAGLISVTTNPVRYCQALVNYYGIHGGWSNGESNQEIERWKKAFAECSIDVYDVRSVKRNVVLWEKETDE